MARTRLDLLLLLLSPLPFAFVAAAFRRYPYGDAIRTSLYMAPSFCLLAGAGIVTLLKAALPRRRAARGVRVAAAVLALLSAVGIALDLARPYKEMGDHGNRDVLRLLCARGRPGDEWVVVNGASEARFRFYLARFSHGPVRWQAPDLLRPDPARFRLIAYTYQGTTLPREPLEASRTALTARQGPGLREEFALDDGVIDVWEFGVSPPP
jgi:hypothetical protein